MSDKTSNALPIPKGFTSWLEWELVDGDDKDLWHKYIDAGLKLSRQDIRDAVQAELDNLKALADLAPELVEALKNTIRVADSYSQLKWTDAEISAISNNRTTLDKAQRLLEASDCWKQATTRIKKNKQDKLSKNFLNFATVTTAI